MVILADGRSDAERQRAISIRRRQLPVPLTRTFSQRRTAARGLRGIALHRWHFGKLHIVQSERTTRIGETLAQPGDAEGLAGRAADKSLGSWHRLVENARGDPGHVSEVGDLAVVVREHSTRKRVDLLEPGGCKPERLPGQAHRFNAAANTPVGE